MVENVKNWLGAQSLGIAGGAQVVSALVGITNPDVGLVLRILFAAAFLMGLAMFIRQMHMNEWHRAFTVIGQPVVGHPGKREGASK